MRERYGMKANPQEIFAEGRPGGRVLTLDGFPHRGQPIMLTEFGGISCSQAGASHGWGYATVADPAQLLDRYRQLLKVVSAASLLSGFCYTQFADTFQEANG